MYRIFECLFRSGMSKLEDVKTKLIAQTYTLKLPFGQLEQMEGVHKFADWLIENNYQIKPKNDDNPNK